MQYTPRQGDIILMNFAPHSGHEQSGRRPALVVSNDEFYYRTKMVMVCHITHTNNLFPLHIPLGDGLKTNGFILCEHVKCQDITSRNAEFVEKVPDDIISEAVDMIVGFVEME